MERAHRNFGGHGHGTTSAATPHALAGNRSPEKARHLAKVTWDAGPREKPAAHVGPLQTPYQSLFSHFVGLGAHLTRGCILGAHSCPSTFNSVLSPNTSLIISGRTLEFLSFHVLSLCGDRCTYSGIFQETGKLEDQMNVPWGRFPLGSPDPLTSVKGV